MLPNPLALLSNFKNYSPNSLPILSLKLVTALLSKTYAIIYYFLDMKLSIKQ